MVKQSLTISLVHPFSAKAIGLTEHDFLFSHSKPHELALEQLQKEGYYVTIDYFTGRILPFRKNVKGIRKNFWTITKPLIKNRHGWRKQHSLLHFLYNWISTPDLTIINTSGHGSAYVFRLAKTLLKRKKPYIAMIGGVHMSMDERAMIYYRGAHHIIVHTENQRKELQSLECYKNLDIRVMPLGIDIEKFVPLSKTNQCTKLLFVGRISRLKQIELCLEVTSKLIKSMRLNVHLNIVGPISDKNYYEELLKITKELDIKESVSFFGMVNQEELIPFYQSADLLLFPSKHESFGMVMVEAMACGTPVASIRGSGGPDEVIYEGINGILANSQDYVEEVVSLIVNRDYLFSLQEKSVAWVIEKYSINKTFEVLNKSVRDALKNNFNEIK